MSDHRDFFAGFCWAVLFTVIGGAVICGVVYILKWLGL